MTAACGWHLRPVVGVVVAHEDVDAAFYEGGADPAGERRVDAADDLYLERPAICWLPVELGDGALRVLFVLVREAHDGLGRGGVQGCGGDRAATLENRLHDALGQLRRGEALEKERTSTSAAVVPFASPETCTTFPRELAPLMEKPFSPVASRRARSASPRLSFGAPAGAVVRRVARERGSAPNMSCFQVSFTSALGGRCFRFCGARGKRGDGAREGRERDGTHVGRGGGGCCGTVGLCADGADGGPGAGGEAHALEERGHVSGRERR